MVKYMKKIMFLLLIAAVASGLVHAADHSQLLSQARRLATLMSFIQVGDEKPSDILTQLIERVEHLTPLVARMQREAGDRADLQTLLARAEEKNRKLQTQMASVAQLLGLGVAETSQPSASTSAPSTSSSSSSSSSQSSSSSSRVQDVAQLPAPKPIRVGRASRDLRSLLQDVRGTDLQTYDSPSKRQRPTADRTVQEPERQAKQPRTVSRTDSTARSNYFCESCNKDLQFPSTWNSHVKTRAHQENVLRAREDGAHARTISEDHDATENNSSDCSQYSSGESSGSWGEGSGSEVASSTKSKKRCSICNVSFSHASGYSRHIHHSKEHQRREQALNSLNAEGSSDNEDSSVEEQDTIDSDGELALAGSFDRAVINACAPCGIVFKDARGLVGHLRSKIHKHTHSDVPDLSQDETD